MSQKIVDIALVEITSASQGNKELDTVVSMTVNAPDPKTPVKVMRRKRRAIGYMRGVPEFSVDLEVVLLEGDPEVDWDYLKRSGEEFLITYEENEGGKRYSLIDCVVNDFTKPFAESGETKASVKITALDQKPEA